MRLISHDLHLVCYFPFSKLFLLARLRLVIKSSRNPMSAFAMADIYAGMIVVGCFQFVAECMLVHFADAV